MSEVLPDEAGNEGVLRTAIKVGALTLPTTSMAVRDRVSLIEATMFVANEPSAAAVPVAVVCESISTTETTSPPPPTAPDKPCTREVPLLGGSAKIKFGFGAPGGVCSTLIVTVEEAESPAKLYAVTVMTCGPSATPERLNVP